MYLFFEEDGAFKAGNVLSSTEASYQVELPTGKRIKLKKNNVFFDFSSPSPTEFLAQSNQAASEMDVLLLWEGAPEGTFTFLQAAEEYFGSTATPIEKAATLICLHSNPVYFYRKGRGSYAAAPEETLKLALAAIERKRQQEIKKDEYVKMLTEEGKAPEEIASHWITLLSRPDKNSIEWKALKEASDQKNVSPLQLLLDIKAIPNAWHYHVDTFFAENFPSGTAFKPTLPEPSHEEFADLPLVDTVAFSIDDSNTTEVDDALSVTPLEDNKTQVGIHISAPSLGLPFDSPVDLAARERMSTVYAPGLKTTMLPDNWIAAYSLDEGKISPVLSLYATVDNDTLEILAAETKLERLKIAANLWYDKIEEAVTEEAIQADALEIPFGKEMAWLWRFSKHLLKKREEVRGWDEPIGKIDWFFDLEGNDENAEIRLKGRKRGAPLDLLVAEMMIFANSWWGEYLDKNHVAGIYRTQHMGKVRLSSAAGPHDGMGLDYYAWATSPLRRYVDMVNQRQLISLVKGEKPTFASNDTELFTVISTFDEMYSTFNDFQNRMDRYWSLRWIEQEGIKTIKATVVKGDLVRFDGLPMMQRVPGLPELPKGQVILMEILKLDYLRLLVELKLLEVMDESDAVDPSDEEAEEETESQSKEEVKGDGEEEERENNNAKEANELAKENSSDIGEETSENTEIATPVPEH